MNSVEPLAIKGFGLQTASGKPMRVEKKIPQRAGTNNLPVAPRAPAIVRKQK